MGGLDQQVIYLLMSDYDAVIYQTAFSVITVGMITASRIFLKYWKLNLTNLTSRFERLGRCNGRDCNL